MATANALSCAERYSCSRAPYFAVARRGELRYAPAFDASDFEELLGVVGRLRRELANGRTDKVGRAGLVRGRGTSSAHFGVD
jgi:hypothetical protein